jgi:hypothetical protein
MPTNVKIEIYNPLPLPTKANPMMESSPRENNLVQESDGIVQGFTKDGFLLVQLTDKITIPIRGMASEPSQDAVLKVKRFPNGIYELMPNG